VSPDSQRPTWPELMGEALIQAEIAAASQETPVGAVVIDADSRGILSRAHNQCVNLNDPTAHAEILALRQAAVKTRNYRLPGTVLVVTLEPCLMCLGAMIQARISGLVFGTRDPRAGAIVSRLDMSELQWLNHKMWYMNGVLENECAGLLKDFFRNKR
jgi:tRNA(adenine34) deaminase